MLRCGLPFLPPNSEVDFTDDTYLSIAEYDCMDGTRLVEGDLTRTCLSDKQWSGLVPICEGMSQHFLNDYKMRSLLSVPSLDFK